MVEELATTVAQLRVETLDRRLTFHKVEGQVEGLSEVRQVAHALAASKQFNGALVGKRHDGKHVLMLQENERLVPVDTDKDGLIKDLHHFASLHSIEMNRCGRCAEPGGGYRDTFRI
jgi:hypothetical protein